MNHAYAKDKLELLLRDLSYYTADEFRRQMMRIAGGATDQDIPDDAHTIKAERDALTAAMAELSKLHSDLTNSDMVCDEDENHIGYVIENEQLDEMEHLLNEPQQALAEIRAEAGRAGFIAGIEYPDKVWFQDATSDFEVAANQYAEQIRQGVEK